MILNTNGFHASEGVKLILILFWGSVTLTNAVLAVCEESYAAAYNHSPPDDRAAPGIRDSKSFGGFLF